MSNKIVDDYNKWSDSYDHVLNLTRDLDQKVLQISLPDINNKDILEAGCGTGKNTRYFSKFAKSVLAFDISPGMLNIAKSKIHDNNVAFFEHDILNKWPVEDNSFDIVSINLVLEHIEHIEFVFQESYRVLKKNGQLYICEYHPEKQLLGSKTRFEDPVSGETIYLNSYCHDKALYTELGLNIGFKIIAINDWYDENDQRKQIPRLISYIYEK